MFYRFKNGLFVEAKTFLEAQEKLIERISEEEENPSNWHKCTCLGMSHRDGCPEMKDIIPF